MTGEASVHKPTLMHARSEGRFSKEDGISINQFVSIAVAEKLAMLQAQTFFAERNARADLEGFDQLMQRSGGEPPRDGDAV